MIIQNGFDVFIFDNQRDLFEFYSNVFLLRFTPGELHLYFRRLQWILGAAQE